MIQRKHQLGFYMLETLLSIMLFFSSCLTLLPIQQQLLIEKKIINDEEKAIYFLSQQMHEVLLGNIAQETLEYDNIISTTLTLTITYQDSLIEGCVTWNNAKEKQTKKCHYALQE
ncbi:hypothetical protein SH601_08350 [Gracilibacillus sp. S3-1-1]|uniref:Uncharacterized protein n=1 Tax=Gracilibacillus pellucidus TaxID=3095368 RepID=A0ACC6M510_9BACI|nr:hypothetical protein [Gracilibacillus sp. S3-1-1]MDX8045998.1 hypothetical protein [Gracilibacillus sp. S3-1-1]